MVESLEAGYLQRREQSREDEFTTWLRTPQGPPPAAPPPGMDGRRHQYLQLVEDLAPSYGVDPRLVAAVIEQESAWNPKAVSRAGAQGLMQLMPATARRFGVREAFDPTDNLKGGMRYLAYLRTLFPGDLPKQLAAYNAGEGAVLRYGGIPPYAETQNYVTRVQTLYQGAAPYVGKDEQAAVRGALGEALGTLPQRGERLESPQGARDRAVLGSLEQPAMLGGTLQPGTSVQVEPGRLQGGGRQQMVPVSDEAAQVFEGTYEAPGAVQVAPGRLEEQRTPLSPVLGPGLEPGLEEPLWQRVPVRMAQGAVRAVSNVLSAAPAFEKLVGIETPFGNTAQDVADDLSRLAARMDPSGVETGLVDRFAEAAGGQIMFFGAGVTAQQGVAALRAATPQIVRAVGLTPAATSAVTEAAAEAGQTYEALRPLVGETEAAKRANTTFWRNVFLLTATNKMGIFTEAEKPLGRVLAGGAMEGVQEVLQYDTQRRQFWVPATHPRAEELQAVGWEKADDRVQQPFAIADAAEAAVLGALMGGALGGLAGEIGTPRPERPQTEMAPWTAGMRDILSSEAGGIRLPQFPQKPSPPRPITLAEGAAGLEPSRFRDDQGRWRIPLQHMPSEELELEDFLRQQGGIKLTDEELQGELKALISPRESGTTGLQNNLTGKSLQHMAELAQEVGFIATADKAALLDAMDRSLRQGHDVYSMAAQGEVPLITDPTTRQLYETVVDLLSTYESRVETQRRGTRPREEARAEGQAMLGTGQWGVDDILDLEPGMVLNDTVSAATVQALYQMGSLLQQKAAHFVASGAGVGSVEEKAFLQGIALFAETDPMRRGVMAEAGRSLGILNDPLSAYNRFLNQFQPLLASKGDQSSLQLARRIAALETPEQVAKTLTKLTQPGLGDMLLEVWINGMLSSPRTQMVNFVSNAMTAAWAIPERLVAGVYGSVLTGGEVSPGEVTAQWWGLTQGIREGWQLAWQVVKTGETQPETGVGTGKQETRYPRALTAQNVGLDPTSALGHAFDFWAEYIGLGSGGRLPSRGLMAADEFFRSIAYRMELAALAYRQARALGLTPEARQAFMVDVLTNPDAAQMRQAASDFALIQTFQRELDPESWGGRIQRLAGATLSLPGGASVPVGRALLPFVRTPVNLARWATERTLPGALYREMWADLHSTGARRELALAKVTMGTIVMTGVAGLALSGIVTGRGPEDEDLLAALRRTGWQPYSVKIGDTSLSYDRFDPFGLLLGMTADIVAMSGDQSLTTSEKLIGLPVFVLARNLTNKTYMSSLARFFDAVSPKAYTKPEQFFEGGRRFLRGQVASLVPASVATLTTALDPYDRELWGLFDGMLERTPWTQKGMPLKRDLWGNPKLLGWGFDDTWVTRMGTAMTPLTIDTAIDSAIDRELSTQRISIAMPSKTLIPRTTKISEFRGDPTIDPQLTPAQYERYVLYSAANVKELHRLGLEYPDNVLRDLTRGVGLAAQARPPEAAMPLVDVLDWLMSTDLYLEQSEGPQGGRDRLIRTVVESYREAGKMLMLQNDDELAARYQSAVMYRQLQQTKPEDRPRVQQQLERALGIGR